VHPYCATCEAVFDDVEVNSLLNGRRFECPSDSNNFGHEFHVAAIGDGRVERFWLNRQRDLHRYLRSRNRFLTFGMSTAPEPALIALLVFEVIAWWSATSPEMWWRRLVIGLCAVKIVDTLVYNAAVVFVSAKPRNIMRTVVFAILAYLELTALFAVIYASQITARFERSSDTAPVILHRLEAWYFSIVTFTTFGPGDIHPAMNLADAWKAEVLVTLEIFVGLFFLIAVVTAFVSWSTNNSGLPSLLALVEESDRLAASKEKYGGRVARR